RQGSVEKRQFTGNMKMARVVGLPGLVTGLAHNVKRLAIARLGSLLVAAGPVAVGELRERRRKKSAFLAKQPAHDVGALLDERLGRREIAATLMHGGEQPQRLDAFRMIVANRLAIRF